MLYIVRHGKTEYNTQRRFQGICDSPLTEEGILGTKKLAEKLKDIDFKAIYTSDLKRTIRTGDILRRGRDIPMLELKTLREMGFGVWEGKNIDKIKEEEVERMIKFKKDPTSYTPPQGGQTFEEFFDQVKEGARTVMEAGKNQDVLVATHGMWIKAFLAIIDKEGIKGISDQEVVENTALTIVDCSNEPKILLRGDTSHLDI